MNRTELIAAVAEQTGGDQAEARRYVDAVFETIMQSVTAGEKVLVTGFGTFDKYARPARTARNPRTGQPVQVAAGYAARFSVGRTFKERVAADRALPSAGPARSARTARRASAGPRGVELVATAADEDGAAAKGKGKGKKAKATKNAKDSKNGGKKAKKKAAGKPKRGK